MVKTNTSVWKLFKQGTAAGLLLLLTVIGLSPVAEAGTWIRRDWSKVQRITFGARTRVRLYKDRAPGGIQKVEGQFQSATNESITLLLPDGQAQTLEKRAVRKVLVYRPFKERYQGWIAAGVGTTLFVPWAMSPEYDINLQWGLALTGLFIGAPTVIAFLVAPKWSGIYNVPRKLRDDAAPTPPPTATKQSSNTLGHRLLEDKISGPELLRLQARRAVMRHDLPLHWPRLPAHAPSSGID